MSAQIFTHREKRRRKRIKAAVLERDGHRCRHCGVALTPCPWREERTPTAATVDHFPIPKSKGGEYSEDNLVACCHACNTARGNGEPWSIPRALRTPSIRSEEY